MLLIATLTAVLAAFVAIAACGGWLRTQRQLVAQKNNQESMIAALRSEIRRVNRGAMGVGKHLIEIEQKLNHSDLGTRSNVPPILTDTTPDYNQVLQLLEQGCTAQQITKACGLSTAEIELMALVRQATGCSD